MGDKPMTPLEVVDFAGTMTPGIRKILETLIDSKIMLWYLAEHERDQELKGLTFKDPEKIR